MVGVALIKDKLRENMLRWFGHVQRRPIDATARMTNMSAINGNVRRKGEIGKT